MKNIKTLLFYVITIGGFSILIYWIVGLGTGLEAGKVTEIVQTSTSSNWELFTDTYHHNLSHPLAILLLQIITIIVVARGFGYICRKIGQPAVIGEIVAGIFLGPSFLGAYFPEFSAFLFPQQSLGNLQFLSQIGLILFMFVIGMELDLKVLQNKAYEALAVSHASIVIPFSLGMVLAYYTYTQFAPANVQFQSFALFMGVAMSITAFPVLARIVQERGMSKTKLGMIVITCAAADDITAWCILAAVIAIVKAGSFVSSLYTIVIAMGYVIVMLTVVRPFLKKLGEIYSRREELSKPVVAIFFIILLLSAYATEIIGIHALFGAFMAGVIMPPNQKFRNIFIGKVEDVALVLLLPLFFVFTGLRTQIGLLNDPILWKVCAMIILVAVAGKFAGGTIAARFVGQTWRDSLIIGALMNTRGLMELVVLNIGYDLGVLSPEIFAMMVLMALVTTFMTGPALDLINRFIPEKTEHPEVTVKDQVPKYKILVYFSNPDRGKLMLRLANGLIKNSPGRSSVTAMHLTPSNELNQYNMPEYELESIVPIQEEARMLNMSVTPLFKPSPDIDKEIIDTANSGAYNLLIISMGQSMFEGTLLGKVLGITTKIINPEKLYETLTGKEKLFENAVFDDRTKHILKSGRIPVAIFIEKNFSRTDQIFVPLFSSQDVFLIAYAQRFILHNDSKITYLDVAGIVKQDTGLQETLREMEQRYPRNVGQVQENRIERRFLEQQDLMLISAESWKRVVETQSVWLSNMPSALIIKPQQAQ